MDCSVGVSSLLELLARTRRTLLGQRESDGHWEGRLSSSALATAVGTLALAHSTTASSRAVISHGLEWLRTHVNPDGGWGDTPESPSNLSTTALVWAVLRNLAPPDSAWSARICEAEAWIAAHTGSLLAEPLARALLRAYGSDRTFSSPILALLARAGCLGDSEDGWRYVPFLPFELALAPRAWLRFARLSVVSYALPALLAVGLARHRRAPPTAPMLRWLRDLLTGPALRQLERLQPPHGGFLEAVPLTAFVALCLQAANEGEHPVARRALGFLESRVREDGSWPVDTHLATWVTSLAIAALARGTHADGKRSEATDECRSSEAEPRRTLEWLLAQQTHTVHPFTGAPPGGWSWTPLPGGVPDADDTSAALLALKVLAPNDPRVRKAAQAGVRWLLEVQNADGGFPTFCRGWGRLPFDRSCPEITAHALAALDTWYDAMNDRDRDQIDAAMAGAVEYLAEVQLPEGAWVPLWFGHQHVSDQTNPSYGTSRVVMALGDLTPGRLSVRDVLIEKGIRWLREAQNSDGGWGGAPRIASSVEETALAIQALVAGGAASSQEVERAVQWIREATTGGSRFESRPIGLYFSRLWYAEELYPLIFTVGALGRLADALCGKP